MISNSTFIYIYGKKSMCVKKEETFNVWLPKHWSSFISRPFAQENVCTHRYDPGVLSHLSPSLHGLGFCAHSLISNKSQIISIVKSIDRFILPTHFPTSVTLKPGWQRIFSQRP
jgi:hypothetical protein